MPGKNKNDLALYLFKQGTNYRAYEFLGVHKITNGKDKGKTVFRVWAPNADSVSLVGDFNGWNGDEGKMEFNDGIWEICVDSSRIQTYAKYKYLIRRGDREFLKADPYANFSEVPTGAASMVFDIDGYEWHDGEFMTSRKELSQYLKNYECVPKPINVYEVHLGSWKRNADGSYMNYRAIADELAAYVKMMGYTHVELLPIAEHPYDGSWGYQICGYYAPTSRFGTPHDFMYFVDKLHSSGIGVIMDWVPAHFPKDGHGLYEFDGAPLYEYQGKDRMEMRSWGTRMFDVARNEVQSFLISNAMYWFEKFHIDALRIDAVASMLYLDYGRGPGEWNPNPDGSNFNVEAICFFKKLNGTVRTYYPDVMMIAEESTAYDGVTRPDGLGFSMKWNMGWMNDTLDYVQTDGYFRKWKHNKMTFSLMYAFNENYMLPISHDEVVHGKKSLIDKMFGSYDQKFDTLRTYLAYMIAHPGKKLMFMGGEYGQFREWDFGSQLEWFMLDFEKHAKLQKYVAFLNRLYMTTPAFWEIDDSWDGFGWIYADSSDDNVYALKRLDKNGGRVYAFFNFAPVLREHVKMPVDEGGWYDIVLDSSGEEFGGPGSLNKKSIRAKKEGKGHVLEFTLQSLGTMFFVKKQSKTGKVLDPEGASDKINKK